MPARFDVKLPLLPVLLILIGGLLPVGAYWWLFGRAPSVSPAQAIQSISGRGGGILVDVRGPEEFNAGHLEGAVNLPYQDIAGSRPNQDAWDKIKGHSPVFICDSGLLSAMAAQVFADRGMEGFTSVRGGMQAWVAAAAQPDWPDTPRLQTASGRKLGLPFHEIPLYEQRAAAATDGVAWVGVALAAGVYLALRRRRSPAIGALRPALGFYMLGTVIGTLKGSWLAYAPEYLQEYLHSLFLAIAWGLPRTPSWKRWAAAPANRRAWGPRRSAVACAVEPRRLFVLLTPLILALAALPLCATPNTVSYNTRILGAMHNYSHAGVLQVFEIRYLPAAAILLLAASCLVATIKRAHAGSAPQVLFAAGAGALAFGLFRLTLLAAFANDQVWFNFWEQVAGLMAVIGTIMALLSSRPAPVRVAA